MILGLIIGFIGGVIFGYYFSGKIKEILSRFKKII